MKLKERDLFVQLSNRVDRIIRYFDGVEFYKQIVRLLEWVETQRELVRVIDQLSEQRRFEEVDYIESMGQLRSKVLEIWSELSKKKIPSNSLDKFAQDSCNRLQIMLIGKEYYSGIDGYHYLRMYIQDVAKGKYSNEVKGYIEVHEGVPIISGEVHQLFLNTNRLSDVLEKKRQESSWGAWVNLKYLVYLNNESDAPYQLKSWAEVFDKSEYVSHLVYFLDFCWDVFSSRYKKSYVYKKEVSEIWGDFGVKGDYLDLGIYGKAKIYFPEKANPGTMNRDTVVFIEEIVKAGRGGIDKDSLEKLTSIRKGDFYRYKSGHNSKLEKAFTRNETKVLAQLVEETNENKQTVLRLVVVETLRTPDKEHKDH